MNEGGNSDNTYDMGFFQLFQFADRNDPLANVRSIRAWLQQLPDNDPAGATEAIRALLENPGTGAGAPSVHRVRALLELDRESGPLQATLQAQYRLPTLSDAVHQRLWVACDGVARAFCAAYERLCLAAVAGNAGGAGEIPAAELHGVFARLFHYTGIQARHGMFRYEQWIPGRWRQLHRHYGEACRRAMAAEPFVLDAGAPLAQPLSPEHEYLQILLLQRLNTGNLSAHQIERAADWLRECAPALHLAFQQPDGEGFWLDLGSGDGLHPERPENSSGELLYLDVEPLQRHLAHCVESAAAAAEAGGPEAAKAAQQRDLAQRLAALWQARAPQLARRGERHADVRGASVVFGWRDIAAALAAGAAQPDLAGPKRAAGAFPLLWSPDGAPAGPGAKAAVTRPQWEVHDVSASGLRLRAPAGEALAQRLGALLALRLESEARWLIGIVRRLRKVAADQVELGVEVIARNAALVAPSAPGSERQSGYSVNGIDVRFGGKSFDALYLPVANATGAADGPSLLLPSSEYTAGRALSVSVEGRRFDIVLAPPLEQNKDWVWTPLQTAVQAA